MGIEGTYLNIIKAVYDKPTANIILNSEKLKAFLLKCGTRMPTLTTSIQHSNESPSHSIQTRKRNKTHPTGREGVKLSLFADDMILYIENLKVSTKKLSELISELGKVAGYKINIQKSVAFLYTNNELSERESKKRQSCLKSHHEE